MVSRDVLFYECIFPYKLYFESTLDDSPSKSFTKFIDHNFPKDFVSFNHSPSMALHPSSPHIFDQTLDSNPQNLEFVES